MRDEFFRNRESKIADAIKLFNKSPLNQNLPQIFKQEKSLYIELRDACKKYEKNKNELITKAKEHFQNSTFEADELIEKLYI